MARFVNPTLRPCLVSNGVDPAEKALFHRWADQAYVTGASLLRGGHPGGQVWNVWGLVELETGRVMGVPPENIQFLDPPHEDYAWPNIPGSL